MNLLEVAGLLELLELLGFIELLAFIGLLESILARGWRSAAHTLRLRLEARASCRAVSKFRRENSKLLLPFIEMRKGNRGA